MTIRRLRLIAFFGFLLLVAASVAVTFAALQTLREDALVINLAGRQRMLIQKMALEVLGTQIGTNRVYREDLDNTAHAYFEATLNALIAGGPAPYGRVSEYGQISDLPQQVTLPPTRSPKILAQLEAVRSNWKEMHAAIHAVLDSDPQSVAFAEAVKTVERLSPVMLAQMDEAVRLYEAEAERGVALVQAIQIGFLAAAAVLLITTLFLTDRWVLNPIALLGAAARRIGEGDLATPVSVTGPGEISRLARSFDDMRQSLTAETLERTRLIETLEARVAERTAEIERHRELAEKRAAEAKALATIAEALNETVELQDTLDRSLAVVLPLIGSKAGWIVLLEGDDSRLAAARNLPPALEAEDRAAMQGKCRCLSLLRAGQLEAAVNIIECERLRQAVGDTGGLCHHATVPIRAARRRLGNLNLAVPLDRDFTPAELDLLTAVGSQIGVAVERARLHERVKARRVEEQTALLKLSQALLGATEAQAILDAAVRAAADALKTDLAAISLIDPGGQTYSGRASVGWPPGLIQKVGPVPLDANTGLAYAIRTRAPLAIPDEARETRVGAPPWIAELGIASALIAPLLAGDQVLGGLVVNDRQPRHWSDDEARLLSLIANDTAQALDRARLFEAERRRVAELELLAEVSSALRQAKTRGELMPLLVEKTIEVLRADAGALILREGERLVFAAARGPAEWLAGQSYPPADDPLWRAVRSGEPLFLADVAEHPDFGRWEACRAMMSGLTACALIPLKTVEAVMGLLHLACAYRRTPSDEERRLLAAIAEMAGNALHRTALHEETKRQALELALAYDTMLEGWARALELRDKETEGHTRRVTEITVRLARALGMSEAELQHVRRGALLHDIGKIGVPDSILLKPGPLDAAEQQIMRRHPQYAYDLLFPITYLRPALDIPYCHHEKWDGTGYPRGLKGEEIPLAARIFAVADVWDALRSDRPYRAAWPPEKIREYLREQAGKHFDPAVVKVFLDLQRSANDDG